MTAIEFKATRQQLLAGFAPKREQTAVFGVMLGYEKNSAAQIIREKERGERPITNFDLQNIAYITLIKKVTGSILAAAAVVPALNE